MQLLSYQRNNIASILIMIFCFVLFLIVDTNEKSKNYESICIQSNSSAKELVYFDTYLLHDKKVYPVYGEKRDGCLILFSLYAHDYNGDGIKDRGSEYAEFVEDTYNPCCVTGE